VLELGINLLGQDLITNLGIEIKINPKEIQVALNVLSTEDEEKSPLRFGLRGKQKRT
jgi:hypothetical protein